MTYRRRVTLLLFLTLLLFWPSVVFAHPLGNFTVNRYSRLTPQANQIYLEYIIDMAEIPAFQELAQIDVDRNGTVSPTEEQAYLDQKIPTISQQLNLKVNGQTAPLILQTHLLEFPVGQANLPLLRLSLQFVANIPATATDWQVNYHDQNFADRLGWQEVVVQAGNSVNLLDSTVPAQDVSQQLRQYPPDFLQSPLQVNQATFHFEANGLTPDSRLTTHLASPTASQSDPFAALIAEPELNFRFILFALGAAFVWGAAHALTPGHGKTVVAAYLVGSRGTMRHAMFLGLTTTITHTAGVFAVGFITLFLANFILPEQIYPWLSVLSGGLVVGLGLFMVRAHWYTLTHLSDHDHHHHDHDDHDHHHHHDDHDHHHHHHFPPDDQPLTWHSLLMLGISGGLLPCPSALVVMLSAIALGRVGFGLILIIAFSLGLASVLTLIGLLFVYAGRLLETLSRYSQLNFLTSMGRLKHALPLASAAIITIVGCLITWQALAQTGIL